MAAGSAGAQAPLTAQSIPAELKANAHAILRYSHTDIVIEDLDEVQYKRKYAITILDEQGNDMARLVEHYSNLTKVNKIKGWLYDKEGKELRTLKEKDIYDRSSYGLTYAFHSDSRIKLFDFNYAIYPYTVEFEIDETLKSSLFLPSWDAQESSRCSVESTDFSVTAPVSLPVHTKEYLMPAGVTGIETRGEGNATVKKWSLKNLPAYEPQPYSQEGNYNSPTVMLASEEFELLDHKGNMKSWQELGQFMYKLNENRDVLPEDKKAMVKSITEGETDTYAKVQKLYAYMQQSTRYVANEYGISGWQTFDAENVAKNGYGDCKGLTNYLKALLKEAGIPAYAALVYAGKDYFKLDEGFPSNIFNHVILCVPQPKDSIWVECTSQQLPAGYLGSFTQGRKVLLVTENGGYVCNTPAYNKEKSYAHRTATLQLDNSSTKQKVKLQNTYSGLLQDDIQGFLKTQPEDKIKEMVNAKFSFPSYSVASYNYKYGGSKTLPAVEEEVEAIVSGIISSTQKRTFINIAWMRNPMPEIFQTIPRTKPLVLDESFSITDTLVIDLPPGMEIESLPKTQSVKYPFASYELRFEKASNKISLVRIYEQNSGSYDAADFEKYQQLYRTINSEKDNLSIVLLNKAS